MRIDKLTIRSAWKNLEGFSIDFDQTRDVAVLIGKNGSAKSNLLEVFIQIFSDINLSAPSPFSYTLDYCFKDKMVHLESEVDKRASGKIKGKNIPFSELKNKWVPRYVVGYYSGASDRFAELFEKHDKLALKETLTDYVKPEEVLKFRRFINARPEHGLFALVSFYLEENAKVSDFLEKYPRIESFDSVLLILHKPEWAKGAGPDEFWGAKGPVRRLLEVFRRNSMAPFTRTVRIPTDFRRYETKELIYLYLPDLASLRCLADEYKGDPRAIFQALDTLRLSELIEDFRVRVRVKGTVNGIHTRQLSEGEQQFLTVLGLMKFTQDEESLYLLDEPDTHLNPAWSLDYLNRLREVGGIDKKSHTLLATHDPLLVSGLLKEEIRVLYRSEEGKIVAVQPEESPRGTGVAGVLTSPLYGLESQLDPFSLKVLKRIYEISSLDDYSNRQRHLEKLRNLVPALVPTESSPDPYRSIAKLAYELAVDKVIDSEEDPDWKRHAIEQLAERLYDDAGEKRE